MNIIGLADGCDTWSWCGHLSRSLIRTLRNLHAEPVQRVRSTISATNVCPAPVCNKSWWTCFVFSVWPPPTWPCDILMISHHSRIEMLSGLMMDVRVAGKAPTVSQEEWSYESRLSPNEKSPVFSVNRKEDQSFCCMAFACLHTQSRLHVTADTLRLQLDAGACSPPSLLLTLLCIQTQFDECHFQCPLFKWPEVCTFKSMQMKLTRPATMGAGFPSKRPTQRVWSSNLSIFMRLWVSSPSKRLYIPAILP